MDRGVTRTPGTDGAQAPSSRSILPPRRPYVQTPRLIGQRERRDCVEGRHVCGVSIALTSVWCHICGAHIRIDCLVANAEEARRLAITGTIRLQLGDSLAPVST